MLLYTKPKRIYELDNWIKEHGVIGVRGIDWERLKSDFVIKGNFTW